MFGKATYDAKLIRALDRALTHEQKHLRMYHWLGQGAAFCGYALVGIALIAAFRDGGATLRWLVALGTVGGLLLGLSVYFISSVKQWPVLKRFLNVQAVQEAAREHEL